jgi:hypothetical protein
MQFLPGKRHAAGYARRAHRKTAAPGGRPEANLLNWRL